MIQVQYTDGTMQEFNSPAEAEQGISETVLGCDLAVTVESIDTSGDHAGREFRLVYSLKLLEG